MDGSCTDSISSSIGRVEEAIAHDFLAILSSQDDRVELITRRLFGKLMICHDSLTLEQVDEVAEYVES